MVHAGWYNPSSLSTTYPLCCTVIHFSPSLRVEVCGLKGKTPGDVVLYNNNGLATCWLVMGFVSAYIHLCGSPAALLIRIEKDGGF